jgi:hypothetical protein
MIRRFLTRILMVLMIGGFCYNSWQLRQTQAQVARLQAELHASRRHSSDVAGTIPNDWLDRAQRHAAKARAAAQRGDMETAQRELSLSADAAQKAITEPALRTQGQVKRLQAQLKSAQDEASALLQKAHQGIDGAGAQGSRHAP